MKNASWCLHHRRALNQCLTECHCSDFIFLEHQTPRGRAVVRQHPQLTLGMWCCLQHSRASSPALHGWEGTGHLGRDLCCLPTPPRTISHPPEAGCPYPLYPTLGTHLLVSRLLITSWGAPLPPKQGAFSGTCLPNLFFTVFSTPASVSFSIPNQAFSPFRIFVSHFQHFLLYFVLSSLSSGCTLYNAVIRKESGAWNSSLWVHTNSPSYLCVYSGTGKQIQEHV